MPEPVIVTRPEFVKAEKVFTAETGFRIHPVDPEEEVLARAIRNRECRAVILGPLQYSGDLYEALSDAAAGRPGLIARFGVGHDGVDKEKARKRNIIVTNTPGVLDVSVAEHAVGMLLCLAHRIAELDRRMRDGDFPPKPGSELPGKTLVLVGFGPIARRVASMAHRGLGMRVMAAGRRSAEKLLSDEKTSIEKLKSNHGFERYTNEVDSALPEADFVSLHIPAIPQNDRFIDARRLARFKPSAMLVNTARGAVIDEDALFDALSSGRLAAAALDVFRREPYVPQSPDKDLRALENVVLTPHVASCTLEANERMGRASLANVRAFFEGRTRDMTRVEGEH